MMERVKHEYKVYDNFIEIVPEDGIHDNSIYEIRIKRVKALNKPKEAEDIRVNVTTKLTPSYCSLEHVKSLVGGYEVPDENILYYIKEASLFVDYIKKDDRDWRITDDDVPYEAVQYTKYKAAYESLLKSYIDRSTEVGMKGTLGDISFENADALPAIDSLLKEFKEQVQKWEDILRMGGFEGRAKPRSAVRSQRHIPVGPFSRVAPPYGPYSPQYNGYGRGVRGQ